jgi:hypothetical protein
MNEEVKKLRPLHNFATPTAIQQVAAALKKHVDQEKLQGILKDISNEALALRTSRLRRASKCWGQTLTSVLSGYTRKAGTP